ncbi:MAG: hypothetical protein GX956_06795 [Firmicutes bacterium]|nr:hypothetical protein [Bacillota bacterium]
MKYEADSSSLSLIDLGFKVFPLEEDAEPDLKFKIEVETPDISAEYFRVLWDLSLVFSPLFSVHASYEMDVRSVESKSVEKEGILTEASYPVLAEFSLLVSTLTQAVGVVPLVISPSEFRELAGIGE